MNCAAFLFANFKSWMLAEQAASLH